MADDYDVEALLDEAFTNKEDSKKKNHKESKKRHSHKSRSKSRSNSRSIKKHKRSSSRERYKERKETNNSNSRDRYRKYDRDKDRDKDRDRDREKERDKREYKVRQRTPSPPSNMVPPDEMEPLTVDERDARTVFMRQLAREVRSKDIENFFRSVGRIRDIRMITDRNSHRPKGIAYVEFANIDSVSIALRMSGEKILNQPVIIQPTMSEKNRAAMEAAALAKQQGPTKLYVGSLHPDITELMLRAIFEPFGTVEYVQLQYDSVTGNSKGFGFVQFKDHERARHAMEKLNGFELAGKTIKVVPVNERAELSYLVHEDPTKSSAPVAARPILQRTSVTGTHTASTSAKTEPPSCCVLFSNAFDSFKEKGTGWVKEIERDITKQVSAYGSLAHIFVDKNSVEGNIYMKFTTPEAANNVVNKMKGRMYAGRVIRAVIFSQFTYQTMFPNS